MDIYGRNAWGARPPKSTTPMGTPEGFVIHWVGSQGMNASPSHDDTCATLRGIQTYEMSREYVDIAYNFAVDGAGRCYALRGWDVRSGANGTSSSNAHAWAVVYMGGPGTPLTAPARHTLRELVQAGAARHGAVSYVRPHRAVVSTQCPGDELAAFCDELSASLRDGGGSSQPPPPSTPQGRVRPVVRRGSRGSAVRELQRLLNRVAGAGLAEDGDFGPRTERAVRNFQTFFSLGTDGIVGPKTWSMLDFCAALKG